jgi:hypothetical protein
MWGMIIKSLGGTLARRRNQNIDIFINFADEKSAPVWLHTVASSKVKQKDWICECLIQQTLL